MLKDFTSLDPSEESQFVVYEQRMQQDSKKALNLGLIVGVVVFVLTVIVYFSGDKDLSDWEESAQEESSELGAEKKQAAPKPAKPEPAQAAPSEGAAAGGEAAEGEAAEGEAAEAEKTE